MRLDKLGNLLTRFRPKMFYGQIKSESILPNRPDGKTVEAGCTTAMARYACAVSEVNAVDVPTWWTNHPTNQSV
jgi:hypothetical protein